MIFRRKQENSLNTEQQSLPVRTRKKEPVEDFEWDKKRIAVFLLCFAILVLALLEVKSKFFPNTSILGASTVRTIEKPTVRPPHVDFSRVGASLDDIKKNIQSLDAQEIASSSPQVQKVLRDIQGIKDLPANQAREMCLKICSGI